MASKVLEIKQGLELLHSPGEVFEVRIPKTRAGTLSGYFDDPAVAATYISKLSGQHPGIYATVNPVTPAVMARGANKIVISQVTTTDAEIMARKWLLLDFDPARPTGISSTDGELASSKESAEATKEWLTSLGWPDPVEACSGNGWHLLYRVDLPNDAESLSLVDCAVKMISSIFTTQQVILDTSVSNAARIWKVYGTLSAKGSSTPDRPHRYSYLASVPEVVSSVDPALLETMANALKNAKAEEFKDYTGEYIADMQKWLTDRGLTVVSGPRPLFANEGQKWELAYCPFNKAHTKPIVGLINNRPIYRCLHNSCSAFRWKEFREKVDPNYKDPDTVYTRLKEWALGDSESCDNELLQSASALQRKLNNLLKRLRDEVPRPRVLLLEELLKAERRRYLKETKGEHNEKGNIVGLVNRVRAYQADGNVPAFWIADYDHRIRVGQIGDVECPKAGPADELRLLTTFHAMGDIWVKQLHCAQVIQILAEEHRVNPLAINLRSKRWDGVERLSRWLVDYMGTKDTIYTRAVGRKWMISAVARAIDPGCQADHMLIFEGTQGVGKSRAARILGGKFYTEYSGNFKGHSMKDMVSVIIGKMIVEMSELAAMRRADMESLKAMLTTTVDDVRLSYERDARAYPRTCVFLGTTNETNGAYITDPTGVRRFWPVRVAEIQPVKCNALEEVVDQLWAEAVEAYEKGESWYDVPAEETAEEQLARQVTVQDSDPWFSKILSSLTDPDAHGEIWHTRDEYINGQPTGQKIIRAAPASIILGILMGIESGRQTTVDSARVARILVTIGFKKSRPSKGWLGATYAYDLARDPVAHIWPAITAAAANCKFPRTEKAE